MIEIDGSLYSGSGTLLRYAMALATLIVEPLHMVRIRAKREKPGLRPQHLQVVLACSSLSGGKLEGAEVGSMEILYHPGKTLEGGDFQWNIGTAGSTTMLAYILIPLALFARRPCRFSLTGGLFQDFAPSPFHLQQVLLPLLQEMGGIIQMKVMRPGYVPRGEGLLQVEINPLTHSMNPLHLLDQGIAGEIRGISLASHLQKEEVSERMAREAKKLLEERGYQSRIEILNDKTALQKGAALLLWTQTNTGCFLGADQSGKAGRRSEGIAGFVVDSLLEDLGTKATADRHLADQLIFFAALAKGITQYRIPRVTQHVEANLWLVEKFLGAKGELQNNDLRLEGIGFKKY